VEHTWGRRGMYVGFWCKGQKERDQQEDLDTDQRIIKFDLGEIG
jgi:hypothetical protein